MGIVKLVISPGSSLTLLVAGYTKKVPACEEAGEMRDKLFRFGMLNKNNYSLENNPHTEDLLKLFPSQPYVKYVMSSVDADTLAATGRSMDDVYVYRYQEGKAVAWKYTTGEIL